MLSASFHTVDRRRCSTQWAFQPCTQDLMQLRGVSEALAPKLHEAGDSLPINCKVLPELGLFSVLSSSQHL